MSFNSYRREQLIRSCIRKMQWAIKKKPTWVGIFQETGQEKRPARMVGLSSLDSALVSKDAKGTDRARTLRLRGRR